MSNTLNKFTQEDWALLKELPIYDPSTMKPQKHIEYSVLGTAAHSVITPEFKLIDTVNDTDNVVMATIGKGSNRSGNSSVSANTELPKQDVITLLERSIAQNKYIFQDEWFAPLLDDSIVRLCDTMSRSLEDNDLYLRSSREYCLSEGTGYIYQMVNGAHIIAGVFSGLLITALPADLNSMTLKIRIPKVVYNDGLGELSEATFMYTDSTCNVSISFPGTDISLERDGVHQILYRRHENKVTFHKGDPDKTWFVPMDGNKTLLTEKKLRVPITKFDFRLAGLTSSGIENIKVETRPDVAKILQRIGAGRE